MLSSGRVVSRCGLRRGASSRGFTLGELADVAPGGDHENIYVEMDASGLLRCRGGAARASRRMSLALAPPHASALLCLDAPEPTGSPATPPGPRLSLRVTADVPPLHELHLWFDEHILAHLDMPFLTLRNITVKKTYSCHLCDAEFEHPNPLKIHMFMSCGPHEADAFWQRCTTRLRAAATSASSVVPPAVGDPAQLEALAAAWGRVRGGAGHVCVYCGKLYSRRYGLKIHIRTHTGYKPLRCRHCLRAFGDPSNLNKHVRLHAGQSTAGGVGGTHACPVCRKPLARRRDLQRHMRAHHAAHLSEHDLLHLSA